MISLSPLHSGRKARFRSKSRFVVDLIETASADRVHFSVIGRYTAWRAGR